jgi:hypothetical protein
MQDICVQRLDAIHKHEEHACLVALEHVLDMHGTACLIHAASQNNAVLPLFQGLTQGVAQSSSSLLRGLGPFITGAVFSGVPHATLVEPCKCSRGPHTSTEGVPSTIALPSCTLQTTFHGQCRTFRHATIVVFYGCADGLEMPRIPWLCGWPGDAPYSDTS